ncbi:protein YhcF [Enterobacter hormaechei]|nr:protein YhcF [Enterobacter hormaechei]SAA58364.1 protein YhcF [Enterobacter hormaechei]
MKKVLLATALSLCVASAFAADTAVLQVKGKLTNAACTPQLSNGGVVDYGTIHLGELSATAVNQLGDKDINLTITCGAPTQVGWVVNDDRGNDSNLLIVFYVQIMPDDFVMQLHRF